MKQHMKNRKDAYGIARTPTRFGGMVRRAVAIPLEGFVFAAPGRPVSDPKS
jgi:hypothetical protein